MRTPPKRVRLQERVRRDLLSHKPPAIFSTPSATVTIYGNPDRGTGILNNELHVGKLVWNRLRYIKDPETGKRVSRPNPELEWRPARPSGGHPVAGDQSQKAAW